MVPGCVDEGFSAFCTFYGIFSFCLLILSHSDMVAFVFLIFCIIIFFIIYQRLYIFNGIQKRSQVRWGKAGRITGCENHKQYTLYKKLFSTERINSDIAKNTKKKVFNYLTIKSIRMDEWTHFFFSFFFLVLLLKLVLGIWPDNRTEATPFQFITFASFQNNSLNSRSLPT